MQEFIDRVLKEVSRDRLWAHVEALVQWDRTSGTEGEFASVDYVVSQLESYGLPVKVHEFKAYLSYPKHGSLTVSTATGEARFRAKTRSFSANTPPDGVTAEIVSIVGGKNMFAADNAVNEISTETVGGKIVLSESGSRGTMLAAQEAGAVGYVHMWPSDEPVLHEGIVTNVWGTPTPEAKDRVPTIPIVTITNGDGQRIREELRSGPVTATLVSATETKWATVRMPVTEIRGREDDFVLVAGHIDSWHYGATDNATGNAACLELARVLAGLREELRRGVRIAWWVGHSTGRYAGSAWYADNHWHELNDRCVAYINIDSPGSLGATDYGEVTAVPETAALVARSVETVTGQTPRIERPMRAGDQSFWGIGISSLYMLLSNRPVGQRAAVGGCGMGWWWHAEEDLLDKADPDVLLTDTKIYAHSLAHLVNDEYLPLDVAAQASEIRAFVSDLHRSAAGHLDLTPAVELLDQIGALASRLKDLPAPEANERMKRATHLLTPVSFTSGDRFDHDAAIPTPPVPALDAARQLPTLDPESDDYGFLRTRLVRNLNQVLHQLRLAKSTLEARPEIGGKA
jgi:N-acetylated-alpha-linked acidic dipeptidase